MLASLRSRRAGMLPWAACHKKGRLLQKGETLFRPLAAPGKGR